jgi:hypothetical protein
MRNFIITEGQLSHLLEVIQTGAYNVTIVGKSFGENNNNWYVNEPKIVEGGSNKLPLNDLSKLKDPGGILNIKVGDIEFKIDLRKWECSNVGITTSGNLQIPKMCYDLKGSDVPVNDKKVITPPISKVEFNKPEKSNNVFYYTETNLKTYKGKELRFFNGIDKLNLKRLNDLPDDSTIIFENIYDPSIRDEYNKNRIRISVGGTPYVKLSVSDDGFSKPDIDAALKMAFPKNWVEDNTEFTAGVRGIHTIGEKTGTSEDWSIMNYFDTKDTVKALINQKWKKEGSGDKIEWLSKIFKTDDEFMEILLDKQWNSIKSGFKTEGDVISDILNYFKNKGIEVDVVYYPPGHKTDRYEKIDFTLKPKDKERFTIQVKPLRKMEKIDGGKIKIQTHGMSDSYKSKPNLDYIVYGKTPDFLVFKNSNYEVSEDGKTVTHYVKPIEISDIK